MQTKKKFVLTPNEELLMNVFWNNSRPLTSVDLTKLCEPQGWNQEHILNMLRSIKNKGLIEVCGAVQYGKQYARSFQASLSREEYAAKLAVSVGIGEKNLAKTAVALVKNVCGTEDAIDRLEQIIKDLREEK